MSSYHRKRSTKQEFKKKNVPQILVGQELKIAVTIAIDRFRSNESLTELDFPPSLTSNERAFIHRYCQDIGLTTKSRGKDVKRYLTVYKKRETKELCTSELRVSNKEIELMESFLDNFPVTDRDREELTCPRKVSKGNIDARDKIFYRENRMILDNPKLVPPKRKLSQLSEAGRSLPIFEMKENVVELISENQVVLIAGDTGSGKTTQVGQYILDACEGSNIECKLICAQPRRLSAISTAERVAAERGEQIGQTVGYQVRLESKMSSETNLFFCTNGILMKLLMTRSKLLSNITHVIVDEIHERNLHSDYLLICLRDLLKTHTELKIILMSAALNIDLFKSYFGSCPVVYVSGNCYDVKTHFLEDVLRDTGYLNGGMKKMLQCVDTAPSGEINSSLERPHSSDTARSSQMSAKEIMLDFERTNPGMESKATSLEDHNSESLSSKSSNAVDEYIIENEDVFTKDKIDGSIIEDSRGDVSIEKEILEDSKFQKEQNEIVEEDVVVQLDELVIDSEICKEMDLCLEQAWMNGNDDAFDQIMYLILNEKISIDYCHSVTKMTPLIVAAARGNLPLLKHLIELGATVNIKDPTNDRNALEWALHFNQDEVVMFLKAVTQRDDNAETEITTALVTDFENKIIVEEDKRRLDLYHKSFDDQRVDTHLIIKLISYICKDKDALKGSILVFLPGYEDIVQIRDGLLDANEITSKLDILMLHSMLSTANQRKVFSPAANGVRKVILSTNIAETSVTINDVVYVIDTGKVKEKTHDAESSVSCLRSVWISKASAIQRRGRAGRCQPGICYHLFSSERFHYMQTYQDAEILRVPIHDICLQTKMVVSSNVSIAEYLSKAPEPPSSIMIRNSVKLLKKIHALDENEDMTDLGKLLVEMPVDPQHGKIIIFGIALKCLDPAVIIAACLSYREPFLLARAKSERSRVDDVKRAFSDGSLSDHMAMLKAFQEYQKAYKNGQEKYFCAKNYLSAGTMEMIAGTRSQILTMLRGIGLIKRRGPGDIKDLNTNDNNWAVVKAVVAAGLYPKLIQIDRNIDKLIYKHEKKVNIHSSSVINTGEDSQNRQTKKIIEILPYNWLCFEELSRLYYSVQIRSVSVISSLAIALFTGVYLTSYSSNICLNTSQESRRQSGEITKAKGTDESDSEEGDVIEKTSKTGSLKIDDWITFQADDCTLSTLAMLKTKLQLLFKKRVQMPQQKWSHADDCLVNCIASLLSTQDKIAGVKNPAVDVASKYGLSEVGKKTVENYGVNDHFRGHPKRGTNYRDYENKDGPRKAWNNQSRGNARQGQYRRGRGRGGHSGSLAQPHIPRDKHYEDKLWVTPSEKTDRYFIMKCNNEKNLEISVEQGIWATTKINEQRLDRAYKNSNNVYLVFSVQGSGHFQGVAKMTSGITDKENIDLGSSNLGRVFNVEWIQRNDIPFQFTQHLQNPWNDNKKVQISRDAQEVEPSVGHLLCELWKNLPLEKNEERSIARNDDLNNSSDFRGNVIDYGAQPYPFSGSYPYFSHGFDNNFQIPPPPFGPLYPPHSYQVYTPSSSTVPSRENLFIQPQYPNSNDSWQNSTQRKPHTFKK